MKWAGARASVIVEAPASAVFDLYSDLEAMPRWSPWLVRVVVADDGAPEESARSTWTLGARGLTFEWHARNTEVVRPAAAAGGASPRRGAAPAAGPAGADGCIAWVSESGLSNRGRVEFQAVQGGAATKVTLAIEVQVPERVAGVLKGGGAARFVEETLLADLKRFRTIVLAEEVKRRRRERKASREGAGGGGVGVVNEAGRGTAVGE